MRWDKQHVEANRKTIVAGLIRADRAAKERAAVVSVCLVGPEAPMPRFPGDNRGGWPVRVVLTTRHREAARKYDEHSPYHRFVVLERVNVENRVQADRLKAALDDCLLGEQSQQGNDTHKPRHKFRDVLGCWGDADTRGIWWAIMLDAALREVSPRKPAAPKSRRAGHR
jgi:hypothetical protein